jgi:cytoskeletal protein CcmA (bactofilin family)
MEQKELTTFLGKDTEFEGKLGFRGTLRIDGRFKGKISASGENLIIAEGGIVEADIQVGFAIISGEIHGNITAERKIEIHSSGKVFGNIITPVLMINDGGIFEGNSLMSKDEEINKSEVGP